MSNTKGEGDLVPPDEALEYLIRAARDDLELVGQVVISEQAGQITRDPPSKLGPEREK